MLLFVDAETTGLSRYQDHVVQVAWILADADGNIHSEQCHVIRPSGYSIPRSAAQIHGITTAVAEKIGKPLVSVLDLLTADAKKATILVAHNLQFDLGILEHDYKIASRLFPFHGMTQVCTMKLSTTWCRLPKLNNTSGFKYPQLQELHYRLFGEAFDGAHDALADTQACMRCYFELVDLGVIAEPPLSSRKTVDDIHTDATAVLSQTIFSDDESTQQLVWTGQLTALPSDRLTLLQNLAKSHDSAFRRIAAIDSECPHQLLLQLAADQDMEVKKAVVTNSTAASEVLSTALGNNVSNDESLIALVAAHSNCSAQHFQKWLEDIDAGDIGCDSEIEIAMAANPVCNINVLAELWCMTDEGSPTWFALRSNPSFTDAARRTSIANLTSENSWCERSAAQKSDCPVGILEQLATSDDLIIRKYVAENLSTPPSILLSLSKITSAADGAAPRACSEDLLEEILEKSDYTLECDYAEFLPDVVRHLAQRNPCHPILKFLYHDAIYEESSREQALMILVAHHDSKVRVEVARRTDTPGKVLIELSRDFDDNVRLTVASNNSCPSEVFAELAKDKVAEVRLAVLANKNCSVAGLKVLAASPFHEYRKLVATHISCTPELFELLATDAVLAVRVAVIGNHACPIEIRAPLFMSVTAEEGREPVHIAEDDFDCEKDEIDGIAELGEGGEK